MESLIFFIGFIVFVLMIIAILVKETINFVVQINGKTRGIIKLKTGDNEKEILEKIKENEKLGNYIKGKLIKKTIFISNKLINIII